MDNKNRAGVRFNEDLYINFIYNPNTETVDVYKNGILISSGSGGGVTPEQLYEILQGYVSKPELTEALGGYVTSVDLTTALSDYVTTSQLATALSDYITSGALQTILADYVTTQALSEALTPLATKSELEDYVQFTDYADDEYYGLMKTNSARSIYLDENGNLQVGGRLGQYPNGGVYYPDTIEPREVLSSSFLMTDGAKGLRMSSRQFGILAGANLTCKSAEAGATQYHISNTQGNRFACFAGAEGYLAIDQNDAMTNGTAIITDISFANGDPISAYFGTVEPNNDIIITVDRTVNPDASTTKLRIYGMAKSGDVINIGQGCGVTHGKALALGQSCRCSGNQTIAFGNSSIVTANNSVSFGHTNIVNKQFCFCAGQGHDFTPASNGAGAVGIASDLHNDTAFAVGNGVFNANGNIERSNALEVLKDGGLIVPSTSGNKKFKITVDDLGVITATEVI